MRRLLLAFTGFVVLVLFANVGSTLLVAQGATLTVSPSAAARGTNFTISASGLSPNTTYTFEFLLATNNSVVFSTERTTDADGAVSLSIRSDNTDTIGDYLVQAKQGATVAAEGRFTLTDGSTPAQTPQIQPPVTATLESAQPTPAPTSVPTSVPATSGVTITVEPTEGQLRDTFRISIAGLAARANVFVTVRAAVSGLAVYDRQWTADTNGEVFVEIFTTADTPTGQYNVQVSDSNGTLLESTIFNLNGLSGRNAVLTISPTAGAAGSTFVLAIANAEAFADLTFTILDPDTRTSVFETIARTNVDGTVAVDFAAADLAEKTYIVQITDLDGLITEGTLTVGTAVSPEATTVVTPMIAPSTPVPTQAPAITPLPTQAPATGALMVVQPAAGPQGTVHNITVTGLPANAAVTFNVLLDGATVITLDKTADASGMALLVLTTNASDAIGSVYTIDAVVNGTVAASGTLEVTGGSGSITPTTGVSLLITPSSGAIGTSHVVEVNGLGANQAITLVVLYQGAETYRTERAADINGSFSMRLKADMNDSPGDYSVQILGADGALLVEAPWRITTTSLATPAIEGAIAAEPNDITSNVVEDSLSSDETTYTYEFDGIAGQLLRITAASSDFDTYLSVLDSSGYELSYNDDYNADLGTDSQISALILPYDDAYTISLTSYATYNGGEGETTGNFTLTIDTITPSPLSVNQPVSVSFGDSDAQYFSLDVLDGDALTMVGMGGDLDTQIEVFDPTGVSTAIDDDGGTGYDPEIMRYTATQSGIYVVKFSTYEAGTVGDAILSVQQAEVNSLNDGARSISLNSKANTSTLTFDATANSVAILTLTFEGGTSNDVTVEALQNGSSLMTFSSATVLPQLSLPVAVPEDGIVRVVVSTNSGTSQYEVSVGE